MTDNRDFFDGKMYGLIFEQATRSSLNYNIGWIGEYNEMVSNKNDTNYNIFSEAFRAVGDRANYCRQNGTEWVGGAVQGANQCAINSHFDAF